MFTVETKWCTVLQTRIGNLVNEYSRTVHAMYCTILKCVPLLYFIVFDKYAFEREIRNHIN